jgi:hypothetical protein
MPLIDRKMLNRRWLYSWLFGISALLLFMGSFLITDRHTKWCVRWIAILLDLVQVIAWVVLWRSRPLPGRHEYPNEGAAK